MSGTWYDAIRLLWSESIVGRFLLCYGIFLWIPLVIPSNAFVSFWFYGMVAGLGVYAYWLNRTRCGVDWRNPLVILLISLHVFTFVHTLVLDHDPARMIRHTCINAAFLMVTYAVFSSSLTPSVQALGRVQRCFLITVLVMSIGSLVWFLVLEEWWMQPIAQRSSPPRLEPLGNFPHPILGANVYSLWALTGLLWWHPAMQARRSDRVLALLAWGLTLIMVLHTQSRGPLLSYLITSLVALYVIGYRRAFLMIVVIGGGILGDCIHYVLSQEAWLPLAEFYERVHILIKRDSHRSEIWDIAWHMIQERPMFGHGLSASFPYGYGGVNPHNLFLSSWYYTGVLGFSMLVSITALALYQAWKMREHPLAMMSFLLIVHGIMACFTDQGQYVKTPSALWMIYWLPIAVVAGLWTHQRKGTICAL